MPRTPTLRILGLVAISALLAASRADAEDPIGIVPGMVCRPIDEDSASDILRNSAGTIASMSSTHPAWVQCPIRMPAVVSPEQTLEWSAQFLAPTTPRTSTSLALPGACSNANRRSSFWGPMGFGLAHERGRRRGRPRFSMMASESVVP